jgi:hypothetical protein
MSGLHLTADACFQGLYCAGTFGHETVSISRIVQFAASVDVFVPEEGIR